MGDCFKQSPDGKCIFIPKPGPKVIRKQCHGPFQDAAVWRVQHGENLRDVSTRMNVGLATLAAWVFWAYVRQQKLV